MKKLTAMLLCLILALGAVSALAAPEYKGEINVGTAFMLTGNYASQGTRAVQAIQMVIDNANAAGGVQGYKINLVKQDTSGDTDTAINALNLLTESDVVAILGPHFSSQAFAVTDIVRAGKVPTIVGGTNYKLPEQNNPYLFLGRTNDLIQAAAAANYITDTMKANKVGMMYCSDDFGQGAFEIASGIFDEKGVPYVAEPHNTTDTDYYSTLLKMKDAGCDVILVWTMADAMVVITRQIYELELKNDIQFFFSPGLADSGTLGGTDHVWLDGIQCVQEFFPGAEDEITKEFVEQYRQVYNETPDFLTGAYGGLAYILVDALNRAEDPTDRESVRTALEQTKELVTPIATYTCDSKHRLSFGVTICQFDSSIDGLIYLDRASGTPE